MIHMGLIYILTYYYSGLGPWQWYHIPKATLDRADTLFRLFFPKTKVTAENVQGVVGGHAVVCGVIHPCQMWSMPHVTLIKQWGSISIHVSSSLDYYTTDDPSTPSKGHCSLVC
jgi:hypothetical protein